MNVYPQDKWVTKDNTGTRPNSVSAVTRADRLCWAGRSCRDAGPFTVLSRAARANRRQLQWTLRTPERRPLHRRHRPCWPRRINQNRKWTQPLLPLWPRLRRQLWARHRLIPRINRNNIDNRSSPRPIRRFTAADGRPTESRRFLFQSVLFYSHIIIIFKNIQLLLIITINIIILYAN